MVIGVLGLGMLVGLGTAIAALLRKAPAVTITSKATRSGWHCGFIAQSAPFRHL